MDISVYIPCYNAKQYLASCLEGVLKQRCPIREVIVVDDGSTDGTGEVAKDFPVKVIRHAANQGLARARNTALQCAQGEYLASLDADCVPDKDWLDILMRRFAPGVAGVGGSLQEVALQNPVVLWRYAHMRQDWGDQALDSVPFLFGSNCVFKKDILSAVGGYDRRYRTNYEDVDISRKIKAAGYVLAYEPQAVVHHHKQDTVSSLLNSFWHWNCAADSETGYYQNGLGLYRKMKRNLYLTRSFIAEDWQEKRRHLLSLDLACGLFVAIRDTHFFLGKRKKQAAGKATRPGR